MEFAILGPLVVRMDGQDVLPAAPKPRALLVRLLVDANRPVTPERLVDDLWDGEPPRSAAQTLQSVASYRVLLERVGFRIVSVDDLTTEWGVILAERLAMYQKLRREAEAAGTPPGHDAFHESYVRFVALVQEGELGGARFAAERL